MIVVKSVLGSTRVLTTILIGFTLSECVQSYSNLFTIQNPYFTDSGAMGECLRFVTPYSYLTDRTSTSTEEVTEPEPDINYPYQGPLEAFDSIIYNFLFGNLNDTDFELALNSTDSDNVPMEARSQFDDNPEDAHQRSYRNNKAENTNNSSIFIERTRSTNITDFISDDDDNYTVDENNLSFFDKANDIKTFIHYPSGASNRAERFNNRPGVHMPEHENMYRGHCRLRITNDTMQTAVDAFFILVDGTLDDVYNLPADYVLRSARTISMMHLSREKLVATWEVVKQDTPLIDISIETLEMFRPLFKYAKAQEMASLNLSDPKILAYIGTHPDLNRHQVGVIASKYIKLNPDWKRPKYLNLMNNLLCGVPVTEMRFNISNSVYLEMNHQIFFHIIACEPIQRILFYTKMTQSQVLGQPYSWNSDEVTRLGLLMSEVHGKQLITIKPEAMAGLSAKVIQAMSPKNLRYITPLQKAFMNRKALNMLAKILSIEQNYFAYHAESSARTTASGLISDVLVLFYLIKSFYK